MLDVCYDTALLFLLPLPLLRGKVSLASQGEDVDMCYMPSCTGSI